MILEKPSERPYVFSFNVAVNHFYNIAKFKNISPKEAQNIDKHPYTVLINLVKQNLPDKKITLLQLMIVSVDLFC